MKMCGLVGAFVLITHIAAAGNAHAADLFVAQWGHDSHPGTEDLPFGTLNHGVTRLTPGDTLWVRSGVYDESLLYNIPSGTSWDSTVRVAAYPGEYVMLRPSWGWWVLAFAGDQYFGSWGEQRYIEIDGINLDGSAGIGLDTVKIESGPGYDAHHIRLQNLTIVGNPNPWYGNAQVVMVTSLRWDSIGGNEFRNLVVTGGPTTWPGYDFSSMFYIQTPDNLIENSLIYDGIGAGIQLFNSNYGGSQPDRTIIRNNVIRDFTRAADTRGFGVVAGGGFGHEISGNYVYNIMQFGYGTSVGIFLYFTYGSNVFNNTVFNNSASGIHVSEYSYGNNLWNNQDFANYRAYYGY